LGGGGGDRFLVCRVVGMDLLLPIAERGPLGDGAGSCVDEDIIYFIKQNYMIKSIQKNNRYLFITQTPFFWFS